MKRLLFLILLLLAAPTALASAEPLDPVRLLADYLAVDTTNPPGNERLAADFLKQVCDREGIESIVTDLGGGRANFRATLRGSGKRKGVILLHHLDVVPAEPRYWRHPPFSGAVDGGEIYGRGAVDIKGKGAIDLAALVALKRRGLPLDRDIHLLAVADEEDGSIGAIHVVEQEKAFLAGCEFLIDEGQTIRRDADGAVRHWFVAVAQKYPLWIKLVFQGRPGHGSIPLSGGAPNRAVRAAIRILDRPRPVTLRPELVEYVRTLLAGRDLSKLPGYDPNFAIAATCETFLRAIGAIDPEVDAALGDTISLTGLTGSDKFNTIPNEASLSLDCRLMPGSDADRFLADLVKLVDDTSCEIRIAMRPAVGPTRPSPADSEFMLALDTCRQEFDSRARVTPVLLLCSTDSLYFAAAGLKTYGFEPYRLTEAEYALGHANDERISVENVKFGVELMTLLLEHLCAVKK